MLLGRQQRKEKLSSLAAAFSCVLPFSFEFTSTKDAQGYEKFAFGGVPELIVRDRAADVQVDSKGKKVQSGSRQWSTEFIASDWAYKARCLVCP